MEQNNANNEDVRQRVDVGVGADVNLNDLPPPVVWRRLFRLEMGMAENKKTSTELKT